MYNITFSTFPTLMTVPPFLEIPIIISISSSLCFCKGMTLDICPDIPEFSTFLSFLTFLKFPPFLIFPSSTKSARGCGSKKIWHFMSVLTFLKFLTFQTFLTFLKFRLFLKFPSSFKSPWACGSENVWHLVSVRISWHSQYSWYSQHSWKNQHSGHSRIPTIPEATV